MKKNTQTLGEIVSETIVASAAYLRKEIIREELQKMIISHISAGDITSQEDLLEFFKTVTLATTALKSVPFDVFQKIG